MKPKYPTRDRHYGNDSRSKKYLSSSIVIDRAAYSSSDPVLQKPVNNFATLVLPVGVAAPLWNRSLSVSYR